MTSQTVPPPSRRAELRPRLIAVIVPGFVLAAIVGVLAWSAGPLLRPAREVSVVQAVFDRAGSERQAQSDSAPSRSAPTVQAAGWLEAEPFYTACSGLADGVVESIEVLEGEHVEQGDVVARLVAEDSQIRLRLTEAELANANGALASAQAERDAARRAWEDPVELDRGVAVSRASLAESKAELARLPSLIDSERATLVRLQEQAKRVRLASEGGAANEFEMIVADQHAAAQQADLAALEAQRAVLEARVDRLRAELTAAERNRELRIEDRRRVEGTEAVVATAEAAVARAGAVRDEAALELERMVIRAPITGYVQRRLKVPGDKVIRMMDSPHSAHIVHLYDPERLQVRVDVPLADAAHVSVGQRCEVIVEVLPDRVFRGEVLRTTHEADLQKNTLQVKVKVLDPDPILRPEMLTRVKFLAGTSDGSTSAGPETEGGRVLVPASAMSGTDGSRSLWLVTNRRNGRGVLASRPVTVVEQNGAWVTVAGDIRAGDLIAVGVDGPRKGERVVIETDAERRSEEPS